ncbi:MAG: cytochrome c [Desulfarculaceae bacterium]|nr:cytochrome c [Desulfarculaceae bacterium]MCF8048215.1 cytochrome c [Desulfarculaceae bacterium]MCF8065518.1 cytochrome c [Desulfarculaceae bacterium]MCF8099673.1 cytochrome c [Desulfarculaceae bacterium]MCF8123577.1 cytochrome c [Desulfarculaceae bacterium]
MNNLHDLLLAKPFGDPAMELILFGSFALHLLFVLLMLGTAMIAVFFFAHSWITGYRFELRWDKRVLRIHLALKSLAVVLGVAPLLIIQVLWSVPFLTAASIMAPYWLGLLGLMIFAFLSLDILGHKMDVHPVRHLIFGVLGLAALVAVPAVFTAVLSLMEHPDKWSLVAGRGFAAEPGLLFHWFMRYLHILGAAALFGGAFHYFFSTNGAQERHYHLSHWMVVATLFQVVAGMLLLVSVQERLTPAVITAVTVGVFAAMLLLGLAFYRNPEVDKRRMASVLVLLPVILVSMLLARQFLQHQAVAPMQAQLETRAREARQSLAPLQAAALQGFQAHLATVYDNGETIYANSCAFCHGQDGGGHGPEAASLIIPPEKLNAVRAQRRYLYQVVLKGVPGSGMPYFSVFDRDKLDSLLEYMNASFSLTAPPQPPAKPGDLAAAKRVFAGTCATCHGEQGQVSAFGADLRPAPPDLTRYGLTPQWAYAVITQGYNGTVMQPFNDLPEATRWGLVSLVASLRKEP